MTYINFVIHFEIFEVWGLICVSRCSQSIATSLLLLHILTRQMPGDMCRWDAGHWEVSILPYCPPRISPGISKERRKANAQTHTHTNRRNLQWDIINHWTAANGNHLLECLRPAFTCKKRYCCTTRDCCSSWRSRLPDLQFGALISEKL